MGNLDKLAKLFADRTNPYTINITVGEVLSASPLRIQYGDSIILEERHLIVADSLVNGFTGEYEDDNGSAVETKTITVKNPLEQGDQVILIPDTEFKTWFLLDKVGVL